MTDTPHESDDAVLTMSTAADYDGEASVPLIVLPNVSDNSDGALCNPSCCRRPRLSGPELPLLRQERAGRPRPACGSLSGQSDHRKRVLTVGRSRLPRPSGQRRPDPRHFLHGNGYAPRPR